MVLNNMSINTENESHVQLYYIEAISELYRFFCVNCKFAIKDPIRQIVEKIGQKHMGMLEKTDEQFRILLRISSPFKAAISKSPLSKNIFRIPSR